MNQFAMPSARPKWFPWAQLVLFSLWIPILFLIPFHGDYEAAWLLALTFAGGSVLGWFDRKWRDEETVQIWAGGFERVFLLLSLWFLAQRLWGDEWEPFPTMLTSLAIVVLVRYTTGLVIILSRHRH